MKKSVVSGIMLALLLIGLLTLAFNIQPVKAATIVVPDDYPTIQGAINAANPGDTVFVKAGTYYLTGSGYIIVNKTISLIGESRETTIIDGGHGIHVKVNDVIIEEFTIRNSAGYSIYTGGCREGATIRNNIIANNTYSLYLYDGSNHIISGNNITNNTYGGLKVGYCSYATLRNNHMRGNGENFDVDGGYLSEFTHDIDVSNTVDGKPVYYWVSEQDRRVPSDAGYIALVNSINITVQNLDLRINAEGLLLAYTKSSSITDNNMTNNWGGICLYASCNNVIYHNNITDNHVGINLYAYSNNNTISENNIANNGDCGISLAYCSDNSIFHNRFLFNQVQADNRISGYANVWDDGYPSGGNYWSDYRERYPDAEELDGSGIWDTPYEIDENNTDNYPLKITFLGDANGDGRVDTADLAMLGRAWDTSVAEPHNEVLDTDWNPNCDFNCDGKIQTTDLAIMGIYWGQTDH